MTKSNESVCCEKCAKWYDDNGRKCITIPFCKNSSCSCHSNEFVLAELHYILDNFKVNTNEEKAIEAIQSLILAKDTHYNELINKATDEYGVGIEEAIQKGRKKALELLVPWIDGNVGASSSALCLYMTGDSLPHSFEAPSDSGDRARCIVLLKAFPEWIERLDELAGQGDWSVQIPLIKKELESACHMKCPLDICDGSGIIEVSVIDDDSHMPVPDHDEPCECSSKSL